MATVAAGASAAPQAPCLGEDDLLALARGALTPSPEVEAHLADCAACSELVAVWVAATPSVPPPTTDLVGRCLGPYRLDARLGAGGMGTVYRGWDERLRRPVAVKVLASVAGDEARARRVDVEARAAAAITHPNVVAVHDVGVADGHPYVVSELVEGDTLRALCAAGPLPTARVIELGRALARGLAAAHAAGVIHRDLKPENVLVTRDGVLKILDFGLAKLVDERLDLTVPGTLCGTAGYMAPEQARGEAVDARADLFAAGTILHELATGRRAFPGGSHAERLVAVLRDEPVGLDASAGLGAVIARCLAKEPARRFQSAGDLAWVLDGLAPAAPPASRPSRRALLVGAGGALATGALGWALGRRARAPRPAAPRSRQLTFHQGRILTARFAADRAGVYLGAQWDDAPLAAHGLRLAGGVLRPLSLPPADVLATSAASLAIALDRRHVDGQCATGRLALVPIDGGAPRLLADDVQDADFFPDGEALAIVTRAGGGSRLEAPLGRALLEVSGWLTHPRVSPDGRAIACLIHPHRNDDAGDVIVVDVGSGAVRAVSTGWASVAGLAWSRRGDRLWFSAARDSAANAVRSVGLRGGERIELEALGRVRLHDHDGRHRLLVSRDAWRLRTRVGGGGRPERDRSHTEFSLACALSADGRRLVVGELGDAADVNGVYVLSSDDGPRLRLGPGMPRALSPDGGAVLATGAVTGGADGGAVIYPVDGGDRRPVSLGPLVGLRWVGWSANDTLVVAGALDGRPARMWRVALAGGEAAPLTAEGVVGLGALDPAGQRLAFVDDRDRLQVVAVSDGASLAAWPGHHDRRVCAWGRDGAIVTRSTWSPVELERVEPTTGARTAWTRIAPPPLGLRAVDAVVLADDGGYAYSYGQELSELFLVELG